MACPTCASLSSLVNPVLPYLPRTLKAVVTRRVLCNSCVRTWQIRYRCSLTASRIPFIVEDAAPIQRRRISLKMRKRRADAGCICRFQCTVIWRVPCCTVLCFTSRCVLPGGGGSGSSTAGSAGFARVVLQAPQKASGMKSWSQLIVYSGFV